MKFLLFITCLMSSLFPYCQNKIAFLYSPPGKKAAASGDIPMFRSALLKQGFLPENIIWDSVTADKDGFISQFNRVTATIKKSDFFLFYTDALINPVEEINERRI